MTVPGNPRKQVRGPGLELKSENPAHDQVVSETCGMEAHGL